MIWKSVNWKLAFFVFSKFFIMIVALFYAWSDNKLLFIMVVFLGIHELRNVFNIIHMLGLLLILQFMLFYNAIARKINKN